MRWLSVTASAVALGAARGRPSPGTAFGGLAGTVPGAIRRAQAACAAAAVLAASVAGNVPDCRLLCAESASDRILWADVSVDNSLACRI